MDIIGQFFMTLACIIPGAYCIGVIPSVSLILLISQLGRGAQKKRKIKKWDFEFDWPWWLLTSFLGGCISFPLSRLIFGASLAFWDYLIVTASLVIFALLVPTMATKSLEGKKPNSIKLNLLACWGGLAGGGLVGIFITWFWL